MSQNDEFEEVTDYRKILLLCGGGLAVIIVVFGVLLPMFGDQSFIPQEQIPTELKPYQEKSIIENLFNFGEKEEAVDQEGLKRAQEEEQLKIAQEARNAELLAQNQDVINQYVEYGLPEETIKAILITDCDSFSFFNGTLPKIQSNVTSADGNVTNLTNETQISAESLGQIYDGLVEIKKQLCQI